MNITLRRRARVLSPDFWEEQFRLLNERSIVHAYVPDGTTKIRPYTFQGCTIMQDIFLPNTITSIGTYAFQSCYALEKIAIPSSCTSIGEYAFNNTYNLVYIEIPSSVRTISQHAFSEGSYGNGLRTLVLNEGLVTIGVSAFQSTSISSLTIPDSVTTISSNSFNNCQRLTDITIGKGITNVVANSFANCRNIQNLTMRRTTPPTIATNTFAVWPTHIYVPAESVELYKTASVWSTYADRIEADPDTQYDSEVEYLHLSSGSYFTVNVDPLQVRGVQITYKLDALVSGQEFLSCGNFSIRQTDAIGSVGYRVCGVETDMYNTYYDTTDKFTTVVPQGSTNPFCVLQNGEIIGTLTLTQPLADSGTNCTIMNTSGLLYTGIKLFDSNRELLFDGITVRKDGEGYLFDRKNNVLYSNSGSGIIDEYGADVVDGGTHDIVVHIPPYDAEIQYIETTGNQYIDTLLAGNTVYGIDMKTANVASVNSGQIYIANAVNDFHITIQNANATRVLLYLKGVNKVGNGYHQVTSGAIMHTWTSENYFILDEQQYDIESPLCNGEQHICLAGLNDRGKAKMRIYYCKLYGQTSNLLFDAIPVRVGNVGWLYDRVSEQLFGDNSLSGVAFNLGPDLHSNFSYVQYIDVTDKYLETDIDAINVGGLYFRYSWVSQQGKNIICGGNFRAYYRAWPGLGAIDVRGEYTGDSTVGNTVRNSSSDTANSVLSMRSTEDLGGILLQASGSDTRYFDAGSLSSISGNVSCFTGLVNGARRIYELKLYDVNGDLIFNGLPVRVGDKGALYDSIADKIYLWNGIGDYGYGPDVVPTT